MYKKLTTHNYRKWLDTQAKQATNPLAEIINCVIASFSPSIPMSHSNCVGFDPTFQKSMGRLSQSKPDVPAKLLTFLPNQYIYWTKYFRPDQYLEFLVSQSIKSYYRPPCNNGLPKLDSPVWLITVPQVVPQYIRIVWVGTTDTNQTY